MEKSENGNLEKDFNKILDDIVFGIGSIKNRIKIYDGHALIPNEKGREWIENMKEFNANLKKLQKLGKITCPSFIKQEKKNIKKMKSKAKAFIKILEVKIKEDSLSQEFKSKK